MQEELQVPKRAKSSFSEFPLNHEVRAVRPTVGGAPFAYRPFLVLDQSLPGMLCMICRAPGQEAI
jgi:hypothetical protein